MKQIITILACSLLLSFWGMVSTSFSHSPYCELEEELCRYCELEEEFFRYIDTYITNPDNLDIIQVRNNIDNLRAYKTDIPIEEFNIKYYIAYSYYVLGLRQNEETLLDSAKSKFEEAFRVYEEEINLPEKKAFAKFMEAWCDLRKYVISTDQDTLILSAAIDTLVQAEAEERADFIENDIRFLKGCCNYLIARNKFERREIDTETLQNAISEFGAIKNLDGNLGKLAKYSFGLSNYLKAQLHVLGKVINQETNISDFVATESLETAKGIFDRLAIDDAYARFAEINYNLSFMQLKAFGKQEVHYDSLLSDSLDDSLRILVEDYTNFLNQMAGFHTTISNVGGGLPEDGFWRDLQRYIRDLQGYRIPSSTFSAIPIPDWRDGYIRAESNFYRAEGNLLGGNCTQINDMRRLLPYHQRRACFLNIFCDLEERFIPFNYDITNLNQVQALIALELRQGGLVPQSFNAVFGAQFNQWSNQHILDFATYLLKLANINRSLYAPSYLCFEYLRWRNFSREKMILLKAFCEFKLGHFNNALALLDDGVIGNFSINNRSEAIFYRGRFYQDQNNQWDSPQGLGEFNSIRGNDPRAAWMVGFAAGMLDGALVNQVFTQTLDISDDPSLERLHQEAENAGGTMIPNPPPIRIGDKDVTLNWESLSVNLEYTNLRHFVASEKNFLLSFWQVHSYPPTSPFPDGIKGPKELYYPSEIEVTLELNHGGTDKHLRITSPNAREDTTTTRPDATITVKVKPSRRYRLISSVRTYYPCIIDTVFTRNKQIIEFQYDEAKKISDDKPPTTNLSDYWVIDFARDCYLVTPKDKSYFQIVDRDGKKVIDLKEKEEGSYSAITFLQGRYYLADRSFDKIYSFTKKDKVKELKIEGLNHPSDMVGYDGYLFIANSGNNKITRYNINDNRVENSTFDDFGRIEGIAIISGKVIVADWKNNEVLSGSFDLRGDFEPLCGVEEARERGMIAPSKISIHNNKYIYVSDVVANKIFMFHQSGIFLKDFENTNIAIPRKLKILEGSISVCQKNGFYKYTLTEDGEYGFRP